MSHVTMYEGLNFILIVRIKVLIPNKASLQTLYCGSVVSLVCQRLLSGQLAVMGHYRQQSNNVRLLLYVTVKWVIILFILIQRV